MQIELYDSDGESSSRPRPWCCRRYSNRQITGIFRDYAPIRPATSTSGPPPRMPSIYCYGSVLDNVTSDPTTVLPQ